MGLGEMLAQLASAYGVASGVTAAAVRLGAIGALEGQKILRSKGILAFTGDDDRYVFQGVHMMLEGDHQRKWKDDEPRLSRLVFIGRELPEQAIRDGFESCITT